MRLHEKALELLMKHTHEDYTEAVRIYHKITIDQLLSLGSGDDLLDKLYGVGLSFKDLTDCAPFMNKNQLWAKNS